MATMTEMISAAVQWADSEKAYRQIVLAAAFFTVPTIGILVVIAGVVPTIMYFPMLFGPLFPFAALHLAVYGGILYVFSSALAKIIIRIPRRSFRFLILGIALVGFCFLSLSEVYTPLSHSRVSRGNLFTVFSK